jgi:hypothetical protein
VEYCLPVGYVRGGSVEGGGGVLSTCWLCKRMVCRGSRWSAVYLLVMYEEGM